MHPSLSIRSIRSLLDTSTCYYVRDLVTDKVMVLVKCAGNVADALTRSLPGPSWNTHRPYLTGTGVEYKAFWVALGVTEPAAVTNAKA